jgi:hypothetical protein
LALEYQLHILRNPYLETIPDGAFRSLLNGVVGARADDIEARFGSGEYVRNRMSFVILDPTAPSGAASDDIVLALALIGPEADFFAPNAVAKAFALREHGADAAGLIAAQNHRLADGGFRFGGAAEVAGTIVGGSGQTDIQDRYQCSVLAAHFNYAVATSRKAWEESHGTGRWYSNEQAPSGRFAAVVEKALRDRS